jgi:ankyrin repeat protein
VNSRLVVGSWWLVVLALGLSTLSAAAQTPDRRLAKAVKANDATTVATLLRGKANPNVADVDGTTPLQWAVRNNNPGLVDRLLAAGADAKAQNRYGVTGHGYRSAG